ncbi:SusC/RagA family TonB-linked outer membrane protein [Fodinibius sediminis]|uniref:TonB-linked outer membrane protein, SusC/RagA family n=1 Tax=Fodinibius sediminis TaxID=1214077 RepID=A0A521CTA8_9BACT|nr:TonB-dependent receptor [Fodinibius sediminis]SMO62717.1 TonB-linked outer membrane protein, SusC/RagA family [Fodinibius sediminis]
MAQFYEKVAIGVLGMAVTCLMLMGLTRTVQAQQSSEQRVVTGTVTDAETGEPLPGVNVMIQATSRGTATNIDGEYSLEVPGSESILVFSFVGYKSQQITVQDREVINVSMAVDLGRLDEVIVVGYGTREREDLTGSVDRIDGEQFKDQGITNVSDMLTGTIAGFNATQGTSASGATNFQIRGPNSLTAGSDPLIVLDGVIYRGQLRDINPNDIESIDILKDASSAAVYGARSASGVVVITTTRGQVGKPVVEFSTKVGVTETTTDHYKYRGPEEYIDFRQNYFRSQGLSQPDHYWTHPDNLPEGVSTDEWRQLNENPLSDNEEEWMSRMNFFPLEREQYLAGETFDWGGYIFPTGVRQEADLSISGGTEDVQYYWSIGRVDNEGVRLGDYFEAIRTRLNVDFHVTDWLSAGINAEYSDRDESTIPASNPYLMSPFSRLYDESGNVEWFPHGYIVSNPALNTLNADRNRKINNLFASPFVEVSLPYNFTHRVTFQPRYRVFKDYQFWGEDTQVGGQSVSGGRADRQDATRFDWMLTNMLTWSKTYGVHEFDLTLVHEVEENRSWSSFQQNTGFLPSASLGYSGLQYGTNPYLETVDTKTTGEGMLARLNYTLHDKYLFTASVRRDGYSAFGQENPRAIFPGGAFAWQISEEDFFDSDLISNLKLRLSYGQNGNRNIGAYSSLAQLGTNLYYDGSQVQVGVRTNSLANPGLRWEETESFNVGLDFGILEGRINGSLDYYDMTTESLLVDRTLPMLTGFDGVTTNIGELGNKGFELTLNTLNVSTEDVNWQSSFNFSLNRNEIKTLFGDTGTYTLEGREYEGEIPDYSNNWFPGESIDVVWDYDITGMWQVEEAEQADVYNLSPGDIKAVDVNDDGSYTSQQDKRFIGHTEPRFRMGLRNDVSYKNFSLSVFLRANLGHIRPFPDAMHEHSTYDRRNTPPTPYWTKENRSNEWPRTSLTDDPFGGGIMIYKDASFVRIQDLTLGYTLPEDLVQRIQLQNLRLFGSVRNLYSFDNWPGWDPESGMTPMPRTFTVGLNLSL